MIMIWICYTQSRIYFRALLALVIADLQLISSETASGGFPPEINKRFQGNIGN